VPWSPLRRGWAGFAHVISQGIWRYDFSLDLALMWPTINIYQVVFHACTGKLNLEAWWDGGCPSQVWCRLPETRQLLPREAGIAWLGQLPREGRAFLTTQVVLTPR